MTERNKKILSALVLGVAAVAGVGVGRLHASPPAPREIPFAPGDGLALEGFEARVTAINKDMSEFYAYVRQRERVAGDLRYDRPRKVWIDAAPAAVAPVESAAVAAVGSAK